MIDFGLVSYFYVWYFGADRVMDGGVNIGLILLLRSFGGLGLGSVEVIGIDVLVIFCVGMFLDIA